MLITSEQLPDLWKQITEEKASSAEKSLVVLHSISEVDSACATRLLMVSTGATHQLYRHDLSLYMICLD